MYYYTLVNNFSMKVVKIGNHNILIKDLIIAALIIALPFLFYLYKLVPHIPVWETSLFNINHRDYGSTIFFIWIINTKLLTIFLLILWFVTCKNWWKYSILIPITIELFKFHSLFNDNFDYFDEIEFIQSLPITLPIIIFLIFVANKLNYHSMSLDLSHELNDEIDDIFNKLEFKKENSINKIKKRHNILKNKKSIISIEEYMNELLILRKKLFEL